MVKMNASMKALIKKKHGKETINLYYYCKNIVSKTVCLNDCVLYDEHHVWEENEITWDFVQKVHQDWTGFEVSQNEILIPKLLFQEDHVFKFLSELRSQLEQKYPLKKFCIIMAYGDRRLLRFHTFREKEGVWLSPEIEKYKNPVLYDL